MHLYEKPQIRNEEPLLFLFIKKKKKKTLKDTKAPTTKVGLKMWFWKVNSASPM